MDGLINIYLLNEIIDVNERHHLNIQRRILRDESNPFELRDLDFKKYFRVSKDIAMYIIEMLRPHVLEERSTAIHLEHKVLAMLFFCGHGSYQKCIGQSVCFPMSQSTFSKVLSEILDAVLDHLLPMWLSFPQTDAEFNQNKQLFYQKYHFPGVLGAIDCTHVAILAPPAEDPIRPGIAYYNRKGYYSLNVQMICDSELKILNCNARFAGATHDSAIWQLSQVRAYLQQKYNGGEINSSWLIGDSGYPLEPWLLTPINNAVPDTPEARYNYAHIRARNCIERCFGILKQKFRCLLKHRVLHYNPVKASKIIYCCAVLHNISRQDDWPEILDWNEDVEVAHNEVLIDNHNLLAIGRVVQQNVVEQHFQ